MGTYIRVIVLVVALGLVLFAMKSMTADSVGRFFAALGVETAEAPKPKVAGQEERFNLCRSRIHAFKWYDGRKVEEVPAKPRAKWATFDPEQRDLDYLALEKWLSQHCMVFVGYLSQEEELSITTKLYLTLEFVNKEEMAIFRGQDNVFNIDGKTFRSDDLRDALNEVAGIAGLNPMP